jgi:ferredoxin
MKTYLQAVASLTQIAEHARLWVSENACMSRRFPAIKCDACVQSCPVQVLRLGNEGFGLSGNCAECGRCAAACPSGALALDGFSLPSANDSGPIYIECQQLADSECHPGALQLPCLGGLKPSQLLAQLNDQGNTLHLIDRGWCQDCRCGGEALHPAAPQVAQAQQLLAELGLAAERIRIEYQPLPTSKQHQHTPEPVLEQQLSRRGFMRHLVGQAASVTQTAPTPKTLGEPVATDGRARIVPLERLQTIAELQRLAGKEAALPARLFHQVSIQNERCQQHHICAATCPVTALRRVEDAQGVGIAFHPQLCTGCGECQRNCPEQAIAVLAVDEPVQHMQPQRLNQRLLQRCFDCGYDFPAAQGEAQQDEPRCPACRKSQELGQVLFGGMF